jgi:hypothetical protein
MSGGFIGQGGFFSEREKNISIVCFATDNKKEIYSRKPVRERF